VQLTLLGTGTSHGVPVIACNCRVCRSDDPRNKRTRCGAWVQHQGVSILIDTPPELRLQAVREGIRSLDAVLFTHSHADHIFGLDDVRRFSSIQCGHVPCYGLPGTLADVRRAFWYAFEGTQLGGGKPEIDLRPMPSELTIRGLTVQAVPALHGSLPVLGYRFGPVAYLTDCSVIPEATKDLLRGLGVLVLGALRYRPHPTHMNFEEALRVVDELRPSRTYFTHLTHDIDYEEATAALPPNVSLAIDGLVISI